MMARRKVLDLLRRKRAKRCLVQTVRGEKLEAWVAEAKAAGLRALAIVVGNAGEVTIDFRASIARIAAGDVVTRCFDRLDHARLWLVSAASARHSSKPMERVSKSVPRVSIPPRISIHPSRAPSIRPSRRPTARPR